MATRRNRSRKASRKASRKNRRSTRRNNAQVAGARNFGIFRRVYSPIGHVLNATGEAVGTVTNTARNVVRKGLRGVNNIGRSVTGHANAAVRNVISRKRRNNRR
jgi:PPE-repeat protein